MKRKMFEDITRIVDIDDLMDLVVIRNNMRALFAEMQTAAQATQNPLYLTYLQILGDTGRRINADIENWYNRHEMQHGDIDDTKSPDGGSGERHE
jgi:hypothetical protein